MPSPLAGSDKARGSIIAELERGELADEKSTTSWTARNRVVHAALLRTDSTDHMFRCWSSAASTPCRADRRSRSPWPERARAIALRSARCSHQLRRCRRIATAAGSETIGRCRGASLVHVRPRHATPRRGTWNVPSVPTLTLALLVNFRPNVTSRNPPRRRRTACPASTEARSSPGGA